MFDITHSSLPEKGDLGFAQAQESVDLAPAGLYKTYGIRDFPTKLRGGGGSYEICR